MYNVFKKIPALMLVALMLASSLTSCEGRDLPEVLPEESTSVSAEGGGTVTDAPDAPVIAGSFDITSDLKIVYPLNSKENIMSACDRLAQTIFDMYGIRVELISEWSYAEGPEIIVGDCGYRENSVDFNDRLYYNESYGYSVVSESEIVISAKNVEKLSDAVELFIDEVLKKNSKPSFDFGIESLKNNEKVAVDYTLNGVKLEEYTIVADKVDNRAAVYLADVIMSELYTKIDIVAKRDFVGGHAIKIGDFGCNSYGGYRYRVGSDSVDGVSTVYIDGDNAELREDGAKLFYTKYLATELKNDSFVVPATFYAYKWRLADRHTEMQFDKLTVEKTLADGINYYEMKYLNYEGKNVDVYAVVVDGDSKAEFRVWAADPASIHEKEVLEVKTVALQARDLERTTGDDVIAAINAGYFDINKTNYPGGMRIIDGKVLCPPGEPSRYPDRWMGITYDGKFVCGNAADYKANWVGKIRYGVGTGNPMMLDGKVNFSFGIHGSLAIKDDGNPNLAPYSAIATTADGGFVMICFDGRPWKGNGTSAGGTSVDMLGIILDLEAICPDIEFVNAIILDGGGSTDIVTERKAGSEVFVTMNDPCDMSGNVRGVSRKVGDIIAVVIPKE